MLKTLIYIQAFCLSINCAGQNLIYQRNKCNSIIKEYFSPEVITQVKCGGFFLRSYCHGDAAMIIDCEQSKDSTRYDGEGCPFELYGLYYTLYSKELNYSFDITIVSDSSTHHNNIAYLDNAVPDCIRKGNFCNYIPKDSAQKIAKLSLHHTQKLDTQIKLVQNYYDKQFYWRLYWYSKAKPTLYHSIAINAITGKIARKDAFYEQW